MKIDQLPTTDSVQTAVQDLVARQPFEPFCVNPPVGGGSRGHGTVIVEVYALGRGVSMAGQQGHLPGRERSFELEANGMVLVFDPLGACQAYGFVAPVEGNVATVGLPVEAVDQENLSKVGFPRDTHDDLSKKTVVLSLPQGTGKTILAESLKLRLGCSHVVDEWHACMPLTPGAIHLTNSMNLCA